MKNSASTTSSSAPQTGKTRRVLLIPHVYVEVFRDGIREGVKDVSGRRGVPCPECVEAVCASFHALVRTGSGSDDTFSSDMAAVLGLEESEVILHGADEDPIFVFSVPASIDQKTAMKALHQVMTGQQVASGGYGWGVGYQWSLLEMSDRVCQHCGFTA